MARSLPTVLDLQRAKGHGQKTMLRFFSRDEARAAEAAGIDIGSVPAELCLAPDYRDHAPTVFTMTGQTHLEAPVADDYLRWAADAVNRGADAVYCSGSLATVRRLADEHIPVAGHVGLVPSRATWTGGFRAVGKTAESATALLDACLRYQDAGAFAVEIEVVPHEVATEISARVDMLLWSMGAGAGCDAQYLFADDILGQTEGHVPRHARAYRDFRAEYARLQDERIAAFREFADDVDSGAYPAPEYLVAMPPDELDRFREALAARD